MHTITEHKPKTLSGSKPRAKERVLAHLEAEFLREDLPPGARLPTSRALASQLGVSVSTVQGVFQTLAQRGVISTEVGNGSFLVNPPRRGHRTLRLGVTFGMLEGNEGVDLWQLSISGAILNHSGQLGRDVSVVPITLARQNAVEAKKTLETYRDRVDGVILRPIPGLYEILDESLLQQIPIVHLNPPSASATSNFVSADYLDGWYKIGSALVRAGRRRIVNLAGFHEPHFGVSDVLRNAGLTMAIGTQIGRTIQYEITSAAGHLEENGYEAAKKIFSVRRNSPDAIVASGDQLAYGVKRYCEENDISIPEDVSVLGGTGAGTTYPHSTITRARQPLEKIGAELVEMLCRIINTGGQAQSAVYLPLTFEGGKSTRASENQFLDIAV